MSSTTQQDIRPRRRKIFLLLPLVTFLALSGLFLYRLNVGDPSAIPSALIGQVAPVTELPAVTNLTRNGEPVPGITAATFTGAVTVVNVWASWCVPCHDEVQFLQQLSKDNRIQLVGINYKDKAGDARRFLTRYGNPFAVTGQDTTGRTSLDWGVYGVPETFIVGRNGRITYKLVGPITSENFGTAIKQEIEKALVQKN
jgi:cytochrome c biogenesis protein CcmG/thiol:disulfide interchange protein DsbE